MIVISVQRKTCEKLFGPRSQAEIVVAEELLDKPSALSAIHLFVGQASLHVTHALAITQLVSAKFCILAANVPGVVPYAEAFIRPEAAARPTIMSVEMRFSFAATQL